MYESKQQYFYGTGRRKSSVARVRVYPGSGKITINGRDIDDYFGLETLKLIVRQPLALTETAEQFDIVCTVAGGGVTGPQNEGNKEVRLKGCSSCSPVLKEIITALTNHVSTCFGASLSPLWSTFGQPIKTILTAMFLHSGYFCML